MTNLIEESEKRKQATEAIKDQAFRASETLRNTFVDLSESIEEFKPQSDNLLRELRLFTTSALTEISTLRRELAEITKTLGSKEHEDAFKQLEQVIFLGERLFELKKTGALDTLIEACIKLELHEGTTNKK